MNSYVSFHSPHHKVKQQTCLFSSLFSTLLLTQLVPLRNFTRIEIFIRKEGKSKQGEESHNVIDLGPNPQPQYPQETSRMGLFLHFKQKKFRRIFKGFCEPTHKSKTSVPTRSHTEILQGVKLILLLLTEHRNFDFKGLCDQTSFH